jgi:hypothetical protein
MNGNPNVMSLEIRIAGVRVRTEGDGGNKWGTWSSSTHSLVPITQSIPRCHHETGDAQADREIRQDVEIGEQSAEHVLHFRRKVYPAGLRDTLPQNLMLRQRADYEEQYITATQAQRAVRRTRDFFEAIQAQGGE